MNEQEMQENISAVKGKFEYSYCVKVGRIKEFWIIRDHNIPTEVLGRGVTPFEAWKSARYVVID